MRDIVSPLDGFRSPFGQMGSFFPAQLFRTGRPGHTADPLPGYVFSDTAGTTPATLGGTVALVNSPVPGQPPLLMADAPDRPIWNVTAEGKYYLQGNGVNQYMATSANVDMSSVSAAAMVAGVEKNDGATGIAASHGFNLAGEMRVEARSSDWRGGFRDSGGLKNITSAGNPLRGVFTLSFLRGGDSSFRISGTDQGSVATDAGSLLNAKFSILARAEGTSPVNARWFGHTFCAMTAAELARVEAYHAYLTGETLA